MKIEKQEMTKQIVAIIKQTIQEQFADNELELIDLEIKGNERKRLLRIFLDKKGGITLDNCKHFSKSLSVILDVVDPMKAPYTLEVSSPGGRQKKRL